MAVQFKHFRKPEGVGMYHHKLIQKIIIYQGILKWMGYR